MGETCPTMDPTGRALALLSLLQTHRLWPGGDLAERLGVSGRTLRRDVDRLRVLGYPVEATAGVDGGYRLAVGAQLPPLVLDDDEAVAIAVGLRAAAAASVAGIEESSVRALLKLEPLLPHRLRRRVGAIHASVSLLRWDPSGPSIDGADLATLAQACRDREQVRFDYERRDGETSRRLVEPHQLVSVGRRWYLVAWDVRRSDWRTFRVDRLRGLRLAGVRFPARTLPAADAASFVAASLAAAPPGRTADLIASGPPEGVREALRWVDADVEPLGDGRCDVRVRVESEDWLVAVVATLAASFDVEVRDDPDLVAHLRRVGRRLGRAGERRSDRGAHRSPTAPPSPAPA